MHHDCRFLSFCTLSASKLLIFHLESRFISLRKTISGEELAEPAVLGTKRERGFCITLKTIYIRVIGAFAFLPGHGRSPPLSNRMITIRTTLPAEKSNKNISLLVRYEKSRCATANIISRVNKRREFRQAMARSYNFDSLLL